MSVAADLDLLAAHFGIVRSFRDLSGQDRPTSPDTIKALLRANGLVLDNDAMVRDAAKKMQARADARQMPEELITEPGAPLAIEFPDGAIWQLELEGRNHTASEGRGQGKTHLPALPMGVHNLHVELGERRETVTLIAAPAAAPSVDMLTGQGRHWGCNGALYALRSERNFGLGDFEDLATAATATAGAGASFFGVNPIHALGWSDVETTSPYSPSHRGFLNTLHIAVDRVPGLQGSSRARTLLAGHVTGTAGDSIDYATYRAGQGALLEALFEVFKAEAGADAQNTFAVFCDVGGTPLQDFALFEALSESHGPDWRTWPAGLSAPDAADISKARHTNAARIGFHLWLQWLAHTQVADAQKRAKGAGASLGLYLDLAVGSRRGAAETWCEGGSIAQGVSVGAPPDHLSPEGQNWNLAAYAPHKLANSQYRAFRQVLRETMTHAGVVRIDHVLGLNRSFWVPDDGSPGGYIRQPFKPFLAVVAIEATRAKTAVIGEDLGLVPEGFRDTINAKGLYSYSVLQYEKNARGQFRSPDTLRPQSLACFGTHDTPTMSGYRFGRDIDWWHKLGWINGSEAEKARRQRQKDITALRAIDGDKGDNLFTSVHQSLARSPVSMISVQLDDLAGTVEAQNLPGTINEHPNWQRRFSVPVEQFNNWTELKKTGQIMQASERGSDRATLKEKAR